MMNDNDDDLMQGNLLDGNQIINEDEDLMEGDD